MYGWLHLLGIPCHASVGSSNILEAASRKIFPLFSSCLGVGEKFKSTPKAGGWHPPGSSGMGPRPPPLLGSAKPSLVHAPPPPGPLGVHLVGWVCGRPPPPTRGLKKKPAPNLEQAFQGGSTRHPTTMGVRGDGQGGEDSESHTQGHARKSM